MTGIYDTMQKMEQIMLQARLVREMKKYLFDIDYCKLGVSYMIIRYVLGGWTVNMMLPDRKSVV